MSLTPAERLKAVDRYASPLAATGGFLLGAAAGTVRRHNGPPLIVRPGGMGDLVLAHLALESLGVPASSVSWVIERRSEPWAEYARLRYICYDRGLPKAVRGLAGRHPVVIDTEQRFGLSRAIALAARPRKGRVVGFTTNRAGRWATVRVPYDRFDTHETVEFSRLFGVALGLPPLSAPPVPARRRAPTGDLVVAIAGTASTSRTFSAERWADIARPWAQGRPALVVGAPSDRELAERIAARLDKSAGVLTDSFGEVCDRIAVAPEILTVDGGLVHVASYLGVPAVAIFTSGRPTKWRPLAPGSAVVHRTDLPCQPCNLFGQVPPCPYLTRCRQIDYREHRVSVPVSDADPTR